MKRLLLSLLLCPCLTFAQERGLSIGKAEYNGLYLTNGLMSLCIECNGIATPARVAYSSAMVRSDDQFDGGRPKRQPLTLQLRVAF